MEDGGPSACKPKHRRKTLILRSLHRLSESSTNRVLATEGDDGIGTVEAKSLGDRALGSA
jgi:hypothetical protein